VDVLARFGPPDEEREIVSGVRRLSLFRKPERGEAFRGLVYKQLSEVADVIFEVGVSDSVRGTWMQKSVGKSKG
jgi:hypothetical protein